MAAAAPTMHRRIMKVRAKFDDALLLETMKLQKDPVPGISVAPFKDNLRYFTVSLEGPSDSPYAGGIFKLEMFLPSDYPLSAPKVRFLTKIWHVNIDLLGRICLDILKDRWSPALQMRSLLLSIQSLLADPNPDDPLNNEAAELWQKDEEAARRKATEWTAKFASS